MLDLIPVILFTGKPSALAQFNFRFSKYASLANFLSEELSQKAVSSAPIKILPIVLSNYGVFLLHHRRAQVLWRRAVLNPNMYNAWANLAVITCTESVMSYNYWQ